MEGTTQNPNALDFACYLGRLTGSKVTGVFLENLVADEKPTLQVGKGMSYINWEIDKTSEEYKEKKTQGRGWQCRTGGLTLLVVM